MGRTQTIVVMATVMASMMGRTRNGATTAMATMMMTATAAAARC
jgi:hypothetical protein